MERTGVKTLIRAVVLLIGATGFCVALSVAASADVVTPRSAYQPAAGDLLKSTPATADMAGPAKAESDKAKAEVEGAEQVPAGEVAEPTPAPEQMVSAARTPVTRPDQARTPPLSPVDRLVHPLRVGLQQLEASLGRVVTACEVGFGTGNGGPLPVLAVLVLAVPLIRRRVIGTRWATDEDVPDFRFVWEQTPPG